MEPGSFFSIVTTKEVEKICEGKGQTDNRVINANNKVITSNYIFTSIKYVFLLFIKLVTTMKKKKDKIERGKKGNKRWIRSDSV